MKKLIIEKSDNFQMKVSEINKALTDGWDIYEGPYAVGNYICIKLIKIGHEDIRGLPDAVPSGLIKFEDEDQDF